MDTIKFYSTKGKYGCFSNFATYPITINGETWPTTEHYFQAQKFTDANIIKKVQSAKTPSEAAAIGRDRNNPLRADWEDIKDDVMRDAILHKFMQYPSIREILLSTRDAILVEHTANDSYWGDGGDGSGKNMLGKILMETREKLKGTETEPPLGYTTNAYVINVHDGDTIEVEYRRRFNVRINGLKAPELSEPGGIEARQALKAKLFDGEIAPSVKIFIPTKDPAKLMDINSFERIVADVWFKGEKI